MTERVARAFSLMLMVLVMMWMGGCAQPQAAAEEKGKFMFWPPAPENPHVQFLFSISTSGDVTRSVGKFEQMIYGSEGARELPIMRPFGVRMYNGQIFVCDSSASTITVLDLRKKEVRVFGQGNAQALLKPIDIAVSADGIKYVADTGYGAIMVYDAADHYAGKVAVKEMRPVSVAVHENNLYVSDMHGGVVRVFDRFTGKEIRTIGAPGGRNEDGKLAGAMGVAVDAEGNVFVNDMVGCRVQKFSPDGKFLRMTGGLGDQPGKFVRPKMMAIDSTGILYVVDNAFQNVQMFNDKGDMLMFFGSVGKHPGAMEMPAGVCVTDTDMDLFAEYVHPAFGMQRAIIVTNSIGANKVNVYALGELKAGKTLADISGGRAAFTGAFNEQAPAGTPLKLQLDDGPAAPALNGPTTQPETRPASDGKAG